MTSFGHTLMTTLHFVLACLPIALFLRRRTSQKKFLTFALLLTAEASLGDTCGAGCGAAAAFGKEEHTIFVLSFIFLYLKILPLCMSAISSSFSFTPLTYLAGLL